VIDSQIVALEAIGYEAVRRLPDGRLAGVSRLLFTFSLHVGLAEEDYEGRYCYERMADALEACAAWDGRGDPPGPWIKAKGFPGGDRIGPGVA